jgi:DNA replication initiation complex subunit (GINS family)
MHGFSHGEVSLMAARVLAVGAIILTLGVGIPRDVSAQVTDATYKARREQLAKELEATEKALADAKGQRAQLQARVESLIAQAMQERAQTLLLSNEQTALQQLDALISTSQDNLMAQRERFASLSDAIGARSGATLIVLLRADSSQSQTVQSAVVTVDSVAGETRTYSGQASSALARGAVDQVYRAPVVPADHAVAIQITVDGKTVTGAMTVPAARQSVTYVQFVVRNGQVTSSTWTSRGTGPF